MDLQDYKNASQRLAQHIAEYIKDYNNMLAEDTITTLLLAQSNVLQRDFTAIHIKGGTILVDNDDVHLLKEHYFYVDNHGLVLAVENRQMIYLSRLILPEAGAVRFRNKDRMDFRKSNLYGTKSSWPAKVAKYGPSGRRMNKDEDM